MQPAPRKRLTLKRKQPVQETPVVAEVPVPVKPVSVHKEEKEVEAKELEKATEKTAEEPTKVKVASLLKPKLDASPKSAKKQKKVLDENSPRMVAARELYGKLIQAHPTLFPMDGTSPKPWKIGLHQDIHERYAVSMKVGKAAVAIWRREHFRSYQEVLAAGGDRYDLDGNPVEPISEEHKAHAERMVNVRKMRAAAKKAKADKRANDSMPVDTEHPA